MRESSLSLARAEILKALGQPNRLRILDFLRDGERCVSEIVQETREQQSNTSRHLHSLLVAGIISIRREGMNNFYGIKHPEVLEILDLATRMTAHEMIGRPRCQQ